MNRGTARTLLRRRINETTADYWTDNDLNDLLNESIIQVQKRVLKIDPEAYISMQRIDSIADENFVPKPQGIFYEIEFAALNDEGIYVPLGKRNFHLARNTSVRRAKGLTTEVAPSTYSPVGRFFYVDPAPETSETNHFQAIFVQSLSVSADTEVPDIPQATHFAWVMIAQRMAVGETGDPDGKVLEEIKDHLDDLPNYYRKSGGTGDRIRVDAASIGK